MGRSDYKEQYKRICSWCGLVSYLGIGIGYDEFRAELQKSKNKTKYKNEVERQCRLAVIDYACRVGFDSFAAEIEKYNRTLPPKVKKRRPETWLKWAGVVVDDDRRRQEYRAFNCSFSDRGAFGDLGLSYESWLKYCR